MKISRKREADKLPIWWKERLRIVLCCQSLPPFIKMAKRNQQFVGFLKWELRVKVTRSCSILLSVFEKDLVSVIDAAN